MAQISAPREAHRKACLAVPALLPGSREWRKQLLAAGPKEYLADFSCFAFTDYEETNCIMKLGMSN